MIRVASRLLVGVVCLLCCTSCLRTPEPPTPDLDAGPVGDFALTERGGRTVRDTDLRGKVWVASFVFTRCMYCPQVTKTVQGLQEDFARYADVRLVTFTVDPEHDNPDELKRYAAAYGADPERWLFLTGAEKDVYRLLHEGFHVNAEQNRGVKRTPGNEVDHSPKLVLVDRDGHIRGYYDGRRSSAPKEFSEEDQRLFDQEASRQFEDGLRRLRNDVATLEARRDGFDFPFLNARLNALAGAVLLLGYAAIRQRLVKIHAACMLSALVISALFLTSYLYFHIVIREGKETRFEDQAPGAPPWMKYVYLGILGSHIVLAVVTVPLALFTAYKGLRGRLDGHVRVARWTLPIWLYVSVTGVVVYWMLYRLYPPV